MNIFAKVGSLAHSGSPKDDPSAIEYVVDHELRLEQSSKVLLDLKPSDIKHLAKDKHDLVLTLENGESLRIVNFFIDGAHDSELYLTGGDDGNVLFALITPGADGELGVQYVPVEEDSDDQLAGAFWENDWALAGLGLLGLGAIGGGIAAALDDDDSGNTGPRAPTISSVLDDVGSVQGSLSNGSSTDDTQPEFRGTGARPGDTITLYEGETVIGSAVVDENGNWSVTPTNSLNEGQHSFTLTTTDSSGHESNPTLFTLTVDTTAPDAPGISTVIDDVEAETGTLNSGDPTNDNRPTFNGINATPGDTITLYDGETVIGSAVVDAAGNWDITPDIPLADGDHSFTVKAIDPAGNESSGTPFTLTIDTLSPAVTFTEQLTNDSRPALSGTVDDPTASVVVTVGGVDYIATNNGDGTWGLADNTVAVLAQGTTDVTVTATDAAGNSGNDTGSINVDVTVPALLSADTSGDGNSIILTYDETLDTANLPAITDFAVSVNGTPVVVTGVNVSGASVTLTLATPVANGDTVTASYRDPTAGDDANATQDLAGNDAASFSNSAVTNNVPDTTAPVLQSADTSGDGNRIVLTYDETLDATNPPAGGNFAVSVNGTPVAVSGVNVSGASVTLILATPVANGDTVTASYSDPTAANDIEATQDLAGNDAASFSNSPVTNNVGDNTAPVLQSAATSGDGNSIILTYDETLDAANPPVATDFAVSVNGTPVTVSSVNFSGDSVTLTLATPVANGDTVTVSYSDPTAGDDVNATQDLAGNDAASFSDTAVTNNVSDTTAPVLQSADTSIDGNSIVLTYDETLDGTNPPATTDFVVRVNGIPVAVTGVNVGGTSVILSLATPVGHGDTVSISYSDPTAANDTSATQDLAGNDALSFSNTAVTNNVLDTTAPVLQSADTSGDGNSIVLTYDETLDTTNPPVAGDFVVSVNGTPVTVNSVNVSGVSVTLSLAAPVTTGDTVTVSYSDPTAGNDTAATQDLAGNDAASFSNNPVTNNVGDTTAPVLQSAATNSDGTGIILTYDEILDGTNPPIAGDFAVSVNGTPVTVSSVNVSGDLVTLTLDTPVANGDTVTVSYSDPTAGNDVAATQDLAGNDAASFSNSPVTNNIADTTAPVLQSADTSSDGNSIVLTYDEALNGTNPPATTDFAVRVNGTLVAVTGVNVSSDSVTVTLATPVGNGDTVSISYSDPTAANDTNATQDLAGNDAASFSNTAVTNNVPDTTAPILQSAATNGDGTSIVLTYDETLDATNTPIAGDFAVSVNGTPVTVTGVNVSSASVSLTLATPVVNGDTVSVSYSDPTAANDTNATQDLAGNDAASFSNSPVTNNVGDTTAPVLQSAATSGDGTGIVLTYDETLDATNTPVAGDFVVNVNGTPVTVSGVNVSGASVSLTLATPVANGDSVTVSYSDPTANNDTNATQDLAGNDAASFSNSPVTNNVPDTTAPTAPAITGVNDNAGAITGNVASGGSTDDTTPTLSGTAEANSTVKIYVGGVLNGTATADGSGAWSYTPSALTDGTYAFTATSTDAAGNVSSPSSAYNLTVDTTAPTAPAITGADDNVGTITGNVASGGRTDDTTPTLSGTGEANSTVKVYVDGVLNDSTTADGSGTWSYTPSALTDGSYAFTVTATDAAGNVSSSSAAYNLTVDTSAPTAPTITGANDNVGAITGNVASGGSTDDTTPTLSGTAEANSTVKVYVDGVLNGSTTADGSGAWSYTPSSALSDGSYAFTATSTDTAGNVSSSSAAYSLSVDATAPTAPAITGANDNVGTITGNVASGGSTDDTTPTLSGTAEANSTVKVYVDGVLNGSTTADGSGAWSYTLSALTDGTYAFTATSTDAVGNVSNSSTAYDLTIDTTAPTAPAITGANDNAGTITGNVASGGSTDDTTPTLSGTAEANSTVKVYVDGVLSGSTSADGSGIWSYTPSALTDGSYVFTATSTDATGNVSSLSTVYNLTVDTSAPTAPAITGANDNVGAITGNVASGGSTDDPTPTLSGTAEANSTVKVYVDGVLNGTAITDGSGVWSYTPSSALANGAYAFTATATDAAGNVSSSSAAYNLTIDTLAPTAPAIAGANDNAGADVGNVASGGTTDDTTPTLSGTAEASSTVDIYVDGVLNGTTTADGSGAWSYTPSALADGSYAFTATSTDAAGNTSAQSASYDLTIDTTVPAGAPTIDSISDNVAPSTGTVSSGDSTNDTTPTLAGSAPAGNTLEIYNGAVLLDTVVADGSGSWTYTPATDLAEGSYSFSVKDTTTTLTSAPYDLVIDVTSPTAPAITGANDNAGAITGNVASGGSTDDTTPTLSGTAEANSTVTIYVDGVLNGTTTANGSGAWSYTPSALADGSYAFTATSTDAAGNVSSASAAYNLIVDTNAPTAPAITGANDNAGAVTGNVASGGSTDDTTPTLSGSAEANSTVKVYVDGVLNGTTTANGSGAWSYTPSALADGSYAFTATSTDAAGNVSSASAAYNLIVDTSAPTAPAITGANDNAGAVTGNVASGGNTDDTTPTLSGTAEANSTVKIYVDGVLNGSTTADGSGVWSYTPSALTDGSYAFTATSTDAAGNVSSASAAYNLIIDTTAPAAPVITSVTDDVAPFVGALTSGGSSNDNTPTLAGTAEANSTVTVYANGTAIGTAVADGTGNWSYTPSSVLADDTYAFTVTATDAAGNQGPASSAFNLTIDTSVIANNDGPFSIAESSPVTPTDMNIDVLSNDSHAPGDTLTVTQAVADHGTVMINADGTLNYTPDDYFNGTDSIVYYVSNGKGGVGAAVATMTVTPVADAPLAAVASSALLGLASGNALGISLGGSSFAAFDPDGDLRQVVIDYSAIVALNPPTFAYSVDLATELGLTVSGFGTGTINISAGGANIDNLAINEFLASVYQNSGSLSASIGGSLTLTATDSQPVPITATASSGLLGLGVLANNAPNPNIIEGTIGNDTGAQSLDGTGNNEQLYGYAGNDELNGNAGDDLLRGGAGDDTLNGGEGNDLLIDGDGSDTFSGGAGDDQIVISGTGFVSIDGGADFDTLTLDNGISLNTTTMTGTIQSIERIDMAQDSAANTLTLTAATVEAMTDASNELQIVGDSNDTLNISGAVDQGPVIDNNNAAFIQYSLGDTTLYVEPDVTVVT